MGQKYMSQKWNFPAIQAGASELNGSVGTVHGLLDEGKASLSRLAAVWGGSGSESYQAVQANWDTTAAELNDALSKLSGTINQAAEAMAHTERGAASGFT